MQYIIRVLEERTWVEHGLFASPEEAQKEIIKHTALGESALGPVPVDDDYELDEFPIDA